jgi:hypothetical protein
MELKLRKLPEGLKLAAGAHTSPEHGMCVMEAVAFVAGERHSDSPECASPILASFLRAWNDGLPDDQRQRLLPYVERLVGTKGDDVAEQKRGLLAADWYLRVFTPTWLELAGLSDHAEVLRKANELTSWTQLDELQPKLEQARVSAAAARAAARAAAWAAAWDAARAAAWDAARAAARDAARAAAWDAARAAAWAAARAAAWDAARAAAWAAAWDAAAKYATDTTKADAARELSYDELREAANKALEPTVERLQRSAFELLEKMLAVKSVPTPAVVEAAPEKPQSKKKAKKAGKAARR